MRRVCSVVHPVGGHGSHRDFFFCTVAGLISKSPAGIREMRRADLELWIKRAADLEESERKTHQSTPEWIERVVKEQILLLFEEMARTFGVDDAWVAHDVAFGFDIIDQLLVRQTTLS